jgi:hypothetical protein
MFPSETGGEQVMFPSLRKPLPDEEIFRADRYVPEPPPTPGEIFGTMAIVLAVIVYMACVITLFASVLGGPIAD